jgi:hypothetical protein
MSNFELELIQIIAKDLNLEVTQGLYSEQYVIQLDDGYVAKRFLYRTDSIKDVKIFIEGWKSARENRLT